MQINQNTQNIIPIMFCFDKNYVLPAAVAFYSLLKNAAKSTMGGGAIEYKLYVLHSDIPPTDMNKLFQTIEPFKDFASLEFINTQHKFSDIWEKINSKFHFSKEVLYKLIVASTFPQYDKMIVSDVDIVVLDSIKEVFLEFDTNSEYYLAGVKFPNPNYISSPIYEGKYIKNFTESELEALKNIIDGAFIVFNLKKIREDKIEEKMLNYAFKNAHKLLLLEQDILNIINYPHIKYLKLHYSVSSSCWNNNQNLSFYTKQEIDNAISNPIILHYAGDRKPWKFPEVQKSNIWFHYLSFTPFAQNFLENLPKEILKRCLINRIKTYINKYPLFFINLNFYKKIFMKLKN